MQDLLKLDFLQKYKVLRFLTLKHFEDPAFADVFANIVRQPGAFDNLRKLKLEDCFFDFDLKLPHFPKLEHFELSLKEGGEY